MTRLGIIVVTGLNNNVNLRKTEDQAWKWLRGLASNAALHPVHETRMASHVCTSAEDKIYSHTVCAHTHTNSNTLTDTMQTLCSHSAFSH